MGTSYSLVYEFVIEHLDSLNAFWTFYIANLIFAAVAYKLGFAKELPVLKSVMVYILLMLGTLILNFFSLTGYPITDSLIIICAVLGIYRLRLYRERKSKQVS
ncbi:YlaH-like family protein [Barrientosiimonas marina]|uniref:YlaH-like family protein n=1 Tax=Lentibacillus kimchii TaxID=1542911 RepID=A0ABW2UPK1_9BACI